MDFTVIYIPIITSQNMIWAFPLSEKSFFTPLLSFPATTPPHPFQATIFWFLMTCFLELHINGIISQILYSFNTSNMFYIPPRCCMCQQLLLSYCREVCYCVNIWWICSFIFLLKEYLGGFQFATVRSIHGKVIFGHMFWFLLGKDLEIE